MATFAPDLPDAGNKPDQFISGYSEPIKGIKPPEANLSTGIALKTAGVGIEGAAEVAQSLVKGVISNDVYDRVDAERDSYTKFLEATRHPSPGAEGPVAPPDLMDSNASVPVPNAIASGIKTAGSIQAGMDANKISPTTYYQRLNDITKDLRASYPGYRDYIDSEVSKITGVTPANAYIQSLTNDLNQRSTTAQKEHDYWRGQIVSNPGFPDAPKMLDEFERTGNTGKVMQWLNYNQGKVDALKLKQLEFNDTSNDDKTRKDKANVAADSVIDHYATNLFANREKFGGISPQDISDRMLYVTQHPEAANDPVYQNLAAQFQMMQVKAVNEANQILSTRGKDPNTGKLLPSIAETIGPDGVKQKLQTITNLFGATTELLNNQKFSPAYMLNQQAEAAVSNRFFQVVTDPSLKGSIATLAAVNKAAPNLNPIILSQLLPKGLEDDIGKLVQRQGIQAIGQTGGKYTGIDGKVYTLTQAIEEQKQAANMAGKDDPPGQVISNLIELRKAITDPGATSAQITNAVKFFYDPTINKGVLNKLMDDYYDPTSQRMVQGRDSAFARLTEQDITKTIWKSGLPTDWQKYSTWAKGEFATQLGNKVRDLNDVEASGGYHIGWNTDKKELTIVNKDGSPLHDLQETPLNLPYRVITNLNQGLRNMKTIAETEGSNVDAYLFKVLRDNGFSPTKEMDGVPSQIMQSLIVGNGGKVKVPVSR